MGRDGPHPRPDGHPHRRGRLARRGLLRADRQPDGADHVGRPRRPGPAVGATAAALSSTSSRTGATLRDLGEHRLKDLGRAERLFQLAHAGLPSSSRRSSTLDLRPNNLPTETSAFVGRDAELRAIRERLRRRRRPTRHAHGPGGIGKTRLAIRAAADQIDRFADGVFFVDLVAATRQRRGRRRRSRGAIGLGDAAERSPLDELRRRLRDEQVLLVLDNFEQVAAAAPTVASCLPSARA